MKRTLIGVILCCSINLVKAQDGAKARNYITISGYAELYYGFDFNKPTNHNRPDFVYSYSRTNEVNLNLGFIKAAYSNSSIRANLAFMAGTYTNANLASEPGVLKNIFEANAGVKLIRNINLWFDAGIFTSHIGYESAIGKNCWTLTRNISSENTPYYESGAKLTYTTPDNKWVLTGLYLNGWQRMSRPDGDNAFDGGIEVFYTPTDKITLNYSNYLGTQQTGKIDAFRFYNNFYGIFQLSKKFGLTTGFDYGSQQKAKGSSSYYHVLSPVAVLRYQWVNRWAVAGRVEYYQDKYGIIATTATCNALQTTGYSVNIDYAPVPNALIRLEGKLYKNENDIFLKNGSYVDSSPLVTASFAVSF